jgi:hypothetical protein
MELIIPFRGKNADGPPAHRVVCAGPAVGRLIKLAKRIWTILDIRLFGLTER